MKSRRGRNPVPNGPVLAVASLAKQHDMNARRMRRRLLKLDEAHGGGLLFRFNDAQQAVYYVDMARLAQLAPALIPPDPMTVMLTESLARTAEIQKSVDGIGINIAALRDNVAACIPNVSL